VSVWTLQADVRWFSNAIINGNAEDADNAGEDSAIGQTLLVRRAKVKVIQGMEEYERVMLKEPNKAAKV